MVNTDSKETNNPLDDLSQDPAQELQGLASKVSTSVSAYIDGRYKESADFEGEKTLTNIESELNETALAIQVQGNNLTSTQAISHLEAYQNKSLTDLVDTASQRALQRVTMALSQEVGQAAWKQMKSQNPKLLKKGFDVGNTVFSLDYAGLDIEPGLATFLNSPLGVQILKTHYTHIQQRVVEECTHIMNDMNTYINTSEQEKKGIMEKVKARIDDVTNELSQLTEDDVEQGDKVKIGLKYLFGAFMGYHTIKGVSKMRDKKQGFRGKFRGGVTGAVAGALAWFAFNFDLDLGDIDEDDVPTANPIPTSGEKATGGTEKEGANTVAEAQNILKNNPEFAEIANKMGLSVNTFWEPISGDTDELGKFGGKPQPAGTILMHLNQFGTVGELLNYKSIASRMSVANQSDFVLGWKSFYYENKAFLAGALEGALPDGDIPETICMGLISVPESVRKSTPAVFLQWMDDILESTQYDAETRLLMYQYLQQLFRQQMKTLIRLDQAVQALPQEQYTQIQDVHLFTNDKPHDPNCGARILESEGVLTQELVPEEYITLVQAKNEQLTAEQTGLAEDVETIEATGSVDSSHALDISKALAEDVEYSMGDIRYEKFMSGMSEILNTEGMERKDILRTSGYDKMMQPLLQKNTEIAKILKSKKTLGPDDIHLLQDLSRMRQDQVQMYNELMVFADFSLQKHEDDTGSYMLGMMDLSGGSLLSAGAKRATDASGAYTGAWKGFGGLGMGVGSVLTGFKVSIRDQEYAAGAGQMAAGVGGVVAGTGQLAGSLLALDLFTLIPGTKTLARTPAALLKKTGVLGRAVGTAMDLPFQAIERVSPTNAVWRLTDYATNHALSKLSLRMKPAYLAKNLSFAGKEGSKKLLYHLLYNDLSNKKAHSILGPGVSSKAKTMLKNKFKGGKPLPKVDYIYTFLLEQEEMLKVFSNGAPVEMGSGQIKKVAKLIEHGYMGNREMRGFLLQSRPRRNMSEIVFNKDAFKKMSKIIDAIEALSSQKGTDKRMLHAMVRHMHPDELGKASSIIKNYKLSLPKTLSKLGVTADEFGKILGKNLHHIDDPKDLSKMLQFVQEYKAVRPRAVAGKVFARMWGYMKKIKSVDFKVPEFVKKFPKIGSGLGKYIPPKLTQSQIYMKTRTAAGRTLSYIQKYPKKFSGSNAKTKALQDALKQVKANPTKTTVVRVLETFASSPIGKFLGTVFIVALEGYAAYDSYAKSVDIAELNAAKSELYMSKAYVDAGLGSLGVAAVFMGPAGWAGIGVGAALAGLHQMKESYYGTMDMYMTNEKEFLQKSLPKLSGAMYALFSGQIPEQRSWKEYFIRQVGFKDEELTRLGIEGIESAMKAWVRLDTIQQMIDQGDHYRAPILLRLTKGEASTDLLIDINKEKLDKKNIERAEKNQEKWTKLPENERITSEHIGAHEAILDRYVRARMEYLENTCGTKQVYTYEYTSTGSVKDGTHVQKKKLASEESVIDFGSDKAGIQQALSTNAGLGAIKGLMTQSRIAQMHIQEEDKELDMDGIDQEEAAMQKNLDDPAHIQSIKKVKHLILTNPRLFSLYYASIKSLLQTGQLGEEYTSKIEILGAVAWEYMKTGQDLTTYIYTPEILEGASREALQFLNDFDQTGSVHIYTEAEIADLPDPWTPRDEDWMREHMHVSSNPLENLLYDMANEQFDASLTHDSTSIENFFTPDEGHQTGMYITDQKLYIHDADMGILGDMGFQLDVDMQYRPEQLRKMKAAIRSSSQDGDFIDTPNDTGRHSLSTELANTYISKIEALEGIYTNKDQFVSTRDALIRQTPDQWLSLPVSMCMDGMLLGHTDMMDRLWRYDSVSAKVESYSVSQTAVV